jgi:hypothetical protein
MIESETNSRLKEIKDEIQNIVISMGNKKPSREDAGVLIQLGKEILEIREFLSFWRGKGVKASGLSDGR